MKLNEIADVRTGVVIARMRDKQAEGTNVVRVIGLKCLSDEGDIKNDLIEEVELPTYTKSECIAQEGDIIVRLSAPYSAAVISKTEVGCLIPSHFAIIRVEKDKIYPLYLAWKLNSDETKRIILLNNSGSTAFGTISSGFYNDLKIEDIPLDKQKQIGDFAALCRKEKRLTEELLKQKTIYNKYAVQKFYDKMKRG